MELPFNSQNILISQDDVHAILRRFESPHVVRDIGVFRCSMVHRSYCTKKNKTVAEDNMERPSDCLPLQRNSNERLEFLGDAVVNLVIGSYVYDRYIDQNEGFLTSVRTKLVCGTMLAYLATQLHFSKFFIVSKQIETTVGRESVKVLEDCFEAFVGALYIDSGYDVGTVSKWLINLIESTVDFTDLMMDRDNPKLFLIKHFQSVKGYVPTFEEPSINMVYGKRQFVVNLRDDNGQIISTGTGTSRKRAESECAKNYITTVHL